MDHNNSGNEEADNAYTTDWLFILAIIDDMDVLHYFITIKFLHYFFSESKCR